MEFVADFHIHSKYSRATSRDMEVLALAKWAKLKGVTLLGTGDFTHHLWLQELKRHLQPQDKTGLYSCDGMHFILSAEISSIFSQGGKSYRVHNLILAPSFSVVDEINKMLSSYGNIAADGRPILGLSCKRIAEEIFRISQEVMLIPAHCLLEGSYVHTSRGAKKIAEIIEKESVYTHNRRLKKVEKVFKRNYKGEILHIKPFYFREGLKTTPEHPFFAIKTHKNCPSRGSFCSPLCSQGEKGCVRRYYKNYTPAWICAKDLEQKDILVYPRFNESVKDVSCIWISKYIKGCIKKGNRIFFRGARSKLVPNKIKIDKDFCRLLGYYLSEGYTNGRDAVYFCFHEDEGDYIGDVKNLMKQVFNIELSKIQIKQGTKSKELIFYSKIIVAFFRKFLYPLNSKEKTFDKYLPTWILKLPVEKQNEIFKGWWRGDRGYTSSRELMNQMKILLLRLGIVPSIGKDSIDGHRRRSRHYIGKREVFARRDTYHFSHLSFFQDKFNLLSEKEFRKYRSKAATRHGWIDDKYIYLPVRTISREYRQTYVYNLEVKDDNSYVAEFATVHNCWTPWFSVFGSSSGFNSLEEAFGEYAKKITALETGLSSDPAMNWMVSRLDKYSLVSNSDAHSPSRIGREANVFDCELNYWEIKKVLETKDRNKFLYTIEFFPEEGKYHYDGHRNCNLRWHPKETKSHNSRCTVCGRPVTKGVLARVEELADRAEGFIPPGAIGYKSLVPLDEIIAEARSVQKGAKQVISEYLNLINSFGSELNLLVKMNQKEIDSRLPERIASGIRKVRERKLQILPGYDGEYGTIKIFGQEEKKENQQLTLF